VSKPQSKVEKLKKAIPENIYAPVPDDVAPSLSYYIIYNSAISDALSLLDEHLGELVKEYQFESEPSNVDIWDGMNRIEQILFNPADCIAIYRVRGEE